VRARVFFQKKVRSIKSAFCFLYIFLFLSRRGIFGEKKARGEFTLLPREKKRRFRFVVRRSMNRDDDDDAMKK